MIGLSEENWQKEKPHKSQAEQLVSSKYCKKRRRRNVYCWNQMTKVNKIKQKFDNGEEKVVHGATPWTGTKQQPVNRRPFPLKVSCVHPLARMRPTLLELCRTKPKGEANGHLGEAHAGSFCASWREPSSCSSCCSSRSRPVFLT